MVNIKYIIMLIGLMGLLHGCLEEEAELVSMVTPEDKTVFDVASVIYLDDQLLDIVVFSGTPEELNALYPFEFTRYDEETDEYLVAYLGDKKIAIQAFNGTEKPYCTEDVSLQRRIV